MTREEKLNWLRNATNKEVLEMYSSTLMALTKDDGPSAYLERQEDATLCKAELLKRMSR